MERHDEDVECVFLDAVPDLRKHPTSFWNMLGKLVDWQSACEDAPSFQDTVIEHMTRTHTRLCLVLDEFDRLFDNRELTKAFFDVLRQWRLHSYFCGFVGIGNHRPLQHHQVYCGDKGTSPFNAAETIMVKPFTTEQMLAYFEQTPSHHEFSQSLQRGIMEYSSGAPGVLGSMVLFAIKRATSGYDWRTWEPWFAVRGFCVYLLEFNNMYDRLRTGLSDLAEPEWEPSW